MLLRIYSMACVCLSLCICVYVSSTAVDSSYIPVEREVKLMVNTSLHLQHVQQSQAAMLQAPPAVLRTNLVVVTGHPTWYAPTPSQQAILAKQQENLTK